MKKPIDLPETLKVRPLEAVPDPEPTTGRPRKKRMPPLPNFKMNPAEQEWFEYFIYAFREEHKDLTPSDIILLQLAGIEYIKYLRVAAKELESGEVISMARQHPGNQMRALLDQLSVTRRARKNLSPEAEERKEVKSLLLGLSS